MRPYFCTKRSGGCGKQQPQRQRFAFTAVAAQGGWIIGRADEGTRGYTPVSGEGFFGLDEKTARERAEEMNKHVGWDSEKDAQMVVLRTMPMKEEHLAELLGRATEIFGHVLEADLGEEHDSDINEFLEDAKGYAKETTDA